MIVRGNPGLGIPSSYDRPQTEKIGYALRSKANGTCDDARLRNPPERAVTAPACTGARAGRGVSVRRRWRVPTLGGRELVDVPDELERTAHALRGRLELHVAFAVLHEDLGHCAPGDVALAAGIPVKQVDQLADRERERARMDPGWRL